MCLGFVYHLQTKPSIRCFIKPSETLERSLEINKQKGKKKLQKRPNYKNVGEDEEEERGPEDAPEGSEGPSKGIKPSGESEGMWAIRCEVLSEDAAFLACIWNLCARMHAFLFAAGILNAALLLATLCLRLVLLLTFLVCTLPSSDFKIKLVCACSCVRGGQMYSPCEPHYILVLFKSHKRWLLRSKSPRARMASVGLGVAHEKAFSIETPWIWNHHPLSQRVLLGPSLALVMMSVFLPAAEFYCCKFYSYTFFLPVLIFILFIVLCFDCFSICLLPGMPSSQISGI